MLPGQPMSCSDSPVHACTPGRTYFRQETALPCLSYGFANGSPLCLGPPIPPVYSLQDAGAGVQDLDAQP
jgi:hypothetical protein